MTTQIEIIYGHREVLRLVLVTLFVGVVLGAAVAALMAGYAEGFL